MKECSEQLPEDFSFDKITISSYVDIATLARSLPVADLKNQAYDFGIIPIKSGNGYRGPYRSRIYVVVPVKAFWDLLLLHERAFSPYKISQVEIARDTYHTSEYDCINAVRGIATTVRKLYSAVIRFDGRDRPKDISKGLWSDESYIFGTPRVSKKTGEINVAGKLKYAFYARDSKLNGQPCVHEEWRISGAGNIVKNTGMQTVHDLLQANVRECFDAMSTRWLTHGKIDHLKLGLWLLSMDYRKKLTDREESKARFRGSVYCRIWAIRTFADLAGHFMLRKQDVKMRGQGHTYWGKRFLRIKNYRRFAVS